MPGWCFMAEYVSGLRRTLILAACGATLAACGRHADHPAEFIGSTDEGVTETSGMSEWVVPPVPELRIRTEDEKAYGMEHGRELPIPEFLQPPLDPKLKSFVPEFDRATDASFVGGASDILPDLVDAWIGAFNEIYPNVEIRLSRPYAGSLGMLEVIKGTYDFVFVSRELKHTDITSFVDKYGYPPLSVSISGASYRHYGFLDAIGFFVNVDNPLNKISLAQIDAIYSSTRFRGLSEIRTWGQLGLTGSWADKPIHVYGVEPWNGFEEFVRQRVLNSDTQRGEWRDDINFSQTAFPIAESVSKDPLAIGYTGLAYVDHGVRVLPLTDESGQTFAATYENVAQAAYPLSRLVYFNTNSLPDGGVDPVLIEFLRFILSREGQKIVLDQGIYLPLRAWQVDAALVDLES